jgi:ATP-binding cassette subfamily F protein 3
VPFDGDLDDYRRRVLSERGTPGRAPERPARPAEPRTGRAEIRRLAAEKRLELAPLRRRIAEIETELARCNAEIAELDAALAAPGLFERDPAKAAALARARAEKASALKRIEDDWLAASAAFEAAMT